MAKLAPGFFAVALLVGGAVVCDCATSSPAPLARTAAVVTPTSTSQRIDALLREAWANEGITPSPAVDDARFLRRATLDITGVIPSADEVLGFEHDPSPDKRQKVVDALLSSPAYAEHWALYWDDVLIGHELKEARVNRAGFRRWLREQFAANRPWNVMVHALVSATGQNSAGGSLRGQAYGFGNPMMAPPPEGDAGAAEAEADSRAINPAVNWVLKYAETPQDLAGAASKTFLGVQIQCAQCHDHKTEKWTQNDFQRFASCFARMKVEPIDRGNDHGQAFAASRCAISNARSRATRTTPTSPPSPRPRRRRSTGMSSRQGRGRARRSRHG